MKNENSFSIQNLRQIIYHLSLLFKKKCLISASFGANKESYITTLLEINEKNNTVFFDYGPKEDLNQRLLHTNKVKFNTQYMGIKVSFVGEELKKISYKGEPAFSMPVPKSLYWMQRREYYRVKSPLIKSSYCQLIVKEDKPPVNLKLYDISLTGFALLNVSKEISELLVIGKVFEQSRLVLSDAGECLFSFEVANKYIINPDKVQKIQKIGCKFINITHSVETIIQRYMQQIQREDLKK
jgi:c-di-GMP-binding flagellar brake protein YcgR